MEIFVEQKKSIGNLVSCAAKAKIATSSFQSSSMIKYRVLNSPINVELVDEVSWKYPGRNEEDIQPTFGHVLVV